jgi:hypothetical protein
MKRSVLTGSTDENVELCQGYVAHGFRHFIYHLPTPYDEETLERFAEEVRPNLA